MDSLLDGPDVQFPVPRALQKAPRQLGVLTSEICGRSGEISGFNGLIRDLMESMI